MLHRFLTIISVLLFGTLCAQNVTVINRYGGGVDTTDKSGFVLKSVSEHTYIINEFEPANTGTRSNLQQMIRYGLRNYIDTQIQVQDGRVTINEDIDDFDLAANSIVTNAIWIHDLPFAQEFPGFSDATLKQFLTLFHLDGYLVSDKGDVTPLDGEETISLYVFQRMVFDVKVRMEREISEFLDDHIRYGAAHSLDENDSKFLSDKNYNLHSWNNNTDKLLDVEPDLEFEEPPKSKSNDEQLELSKQIVKLLESNNEILARHDARFDEMQQQIDGLKEAKASSQNAYLEGEIAELRELIMDLSGGGLPRKESSGTNASPVVVVFEKNQHDLSLANQALLNSAVSRLNADISLHGKITGFADKTGNAEFNAWISKQRAQAVQAYMIGQGITPQRLEINFLGDTKSDYANPADRKVQVEFLSSEMSQH